MIKNYITTFLIAAAFGLCFQWAHMPLPWTLGPLSAVIFLKIGLNKPVRWPINIRNTAMLLLGYTMGSPFTPETGRHILLQLPAMLILTLITTALCLIGGYITGRFTGVSLATSLLGSMPGGLSQMAIVCEEIKEANPAAVTLMQTIRVVTVVFVVPFLVLHGLADVVDPINRTSAAFDTAEFPILLLFAAVICVTTFLAKRLKLPNPYLTIPIISTACLVLAGVHAPKLPPLAVAVAQICVGIRMGMSINPTSLANWKQVCFYNFLNIAAAIVLFLGVDWLYTRLFPIDLVTVFISTAPGGMTEMGLTAMMVHADLSTVVSFQLFRLLFILLVAIPTIRWWLHRRNQRQQIPQ